MRPAGSGSTETTRTPAGVATLRRPSGSAQGEALRGPDNTPREVRRATEATVIEQLIDPWLRANPPEMGCTIYSVQGVAGLGAAGCMVAGLDLGYRPPG